MVFYGSMIRIPRTKRGLAAYISAVFVLTFSLFATANAPTPKNKILAPSPIAQTTNETNVVLGESTEQTYLVTRVIDGDTFEIEGGKKIRMIGIDTPETVAPRKEIECFGKEASAKTTELLLGTRVKLVKDVSETDSFGRLLRYVYVGDMFVNKVLVWEGYAHARSYPPDVKHQKELQIDEKHARDAKVGLWGEVCS